MNRIVEVSRGILGKFGAPVFQFVDNKYTRWTERYPKGSRLIAQVQLSAKTDTGEEWLNFNVEELIPHARAGHTSRVVSFTLSGPELEMFRAYLRGDYKRAGDEQ